MHRDIKPGNILIDADDGKPYLVDFGLALRDQIVSTGLQKHSRAPTIIGTPSYMSPEQARGEGHRVDGRSDIFSLGVVFYELLTNRRPFLGDSLAEVLQQVISHDPVPPRDRDDVILKELDRICMKALMKRASDRYAEARDLSSDLQAKLARAVSHTQSGMVTARSDAGASGPIGLESPESLRSVDRPLQIVPRGLRSFQEHGAEFFLELLPGARDREGLPDSLRFWKTRIEQHDADQTFSVGLLYGPSGCGKSSFVRAGLLPRLDEQVIPVFVECTSDQTESRLRHRLARQCPDLPEELDLKDALTALRRGRGVPSGKKVLIVLDQFEQWLHARRGQEDTELAQALRQCDGGMLQTVLLVRDDFWMAATSLMRELEVRIVEGENSSAVELFTEKHARRVLVAFGRAFDALPQRARDFSKEQQQSMDQAVSGLSEDGKVICVRLALFAEMMKHKPWTPTALRQVGGTSGVGVAFLEETFGGSSAMPEVRYHQKAARAVLHSLLPEAGSNIKGRMKSRGELLAVAEYEEAAEFDDLLHVLDTEIRLITPTDPTGHSPESSSVSITKSGEKYYQLAHDYLVPALRDWLTRKQRETRRGRAELRLAERAEDWRARPQNRRLPSLAEHVAFRTLTTHSSWTEPQRAMMSRAAGVHGLLLALTVLLTERLRTESDVGVRRALLLALGEVPEANLRPADKESLIATVLD